MRGRANRKSRWAILGLLLLAACSNAPATLSDATRYARIGVLPAYEPEVSKRTPPGFFDSAVVEHLDLDLGVNQLVVDRVMKYMSQGHKMVDLQSFSAGYIGTPKVLWAGERKIFGDSRPMLIPKFRFTESAEDPKNWAARLKSAAMSLVLSRSAPVRLAV